MNKIILIAALLSLAACSNQGISPYQMAKLQYQDCLKYRDDCRNEKANYEMALAEAQMQNQRLAASQVTANMWGMAASRQLMRDSQPTYTPAPRTVICNRMGNTVVCN